LTAPARDDMGEARVGTKERLSDRTKKLMKEVRWRAETNTASPGRRTL
jgi:hypothetical protein